MLQAVSCLTRLAEAERRAGRARILTDDGTRGVSAVGTLCWFTEMKQDNLSLIDTDS